MLGEHCLGFVETDEDQLCRGRYVAKADGVDAPRRHRCAKVEVLNTT
jgi:hypothetical protein